MKAFVPSSLKPVVFACIAVVLPVSSFSQGSLTPPGAPAPTMKSLQQVEPCTPISAAGFTITNSGSYYLTTNLVGVASQAGITVSVDEVTLDLNGFALIGVPGSSHGITTASARRNLAVYNGTIRGWGVAGINLPNAENSQFQNLRVTGNGAGGLLLGLNCQVKNCFVQQNAADSAIRVGHGSVIEDCSVISNSFQGIITGDSCRIAGCTVRNNSTGGLDGIAAGRGCLVQNCAASENGDPGVSGTGGGIAVNEGSTVLGCTVWSNAVEGIFAPSGCLIKDCNARANYIGISTAGSTVQNCVVTSSDTDGIAVSFRCLVLENNSSENIAAGIHATSTDNRIEGNTVTDNGVGVKVDQPFNVVIRNHASFNTANTNNNFVVVGTNFLGTIENRTTMNANKNPHANFSF